MCLSQIRVHRDVGQKTGCVLIGVVRCYVDDVPVFAMHVAFLYGLGFLSWGLGCDGETVRSCS
jgi:hypothetical protein